MYFKFSRAESLIEVTIAVFVVGIITTSAMAMLLSGMHTGRSTHDRIIAINLAREGIEAVRVVRDTNWLKNSDQRAHWLDDLGDSVVGDAYIARLDTAGTTPTYNWSLESKAGWDITDPAAAFSVCKVGNFYMQNGSVCVDSELNENKFYRAITLRAVTGHDAEGSGPADVLEVHAYVAWPEANGRVSSVELVTYLTDFRGRVYKE